MSSFQDIPAYFFPSIPLHKNLFLSTKTPKMHSPARRRWLQYTLWTFILSSVAFFLYLTRPDEPKLFMTRLNQISLGVEQRVKWWDWHDTDEEIYCRGPNWHPNKPPIPNVVHYVFLSPRDQPSELSYRAFLSIKAAILRMQADEIKIHTYETGINPDNPWFKQLQDHVTVVKHDRDLLRGPRGRPVDDFMIQHQADFMRISILLQEGGIYFDNDVFAFKPFTDLLKSSRDVVLGHEGGNRYGFGNAIIVARAHAEFLQKWQDSYATFNDWIYNYHSVRMPKLLQVEYPHLICPLSPTVFFWPTWAASHARYMQRPVSEEAIAELRANMSRFGGAMYENQLALHQGVTLEPEKVMYEDTRLNVLLRDLVDAPLPRRAVRRNSTGLS